MKNEMKTRSTQLLFGNDSVVIQKYNSGIAGGRTLNVSGWPLTTIPAGTLVINGKGASETETFYKPMPIEADSAKEGEYKYSALPSGYAYVGFLSHTMGVDDPEASIMFDGVVNEECLPYALGDLKSAVKTALPLIAFVQDEIA